MLKQTTSSQRVRFVGSPTKERFIKELRRRVDAYFSENNISQYANGEMYLKTIIAIVAWITVYVNIVNGVFTTNVWLLLLGYMILGYVNIFIAFNIMHDATHEAYSPSKRVNKILGYSMDFIGGNQYLFRAMHGAHHGFVNIRGIDVTLETHGMFRFSPDEPWLPRHRWQHYYTCLLYALAMLQWTTMKDFKWFFGEGHIGNKKNISHPMQA